MLQAMSTMSSATTVASSHGAPESTQQDTATHTQSKSQFQVNNSSSKNLLNPLITNNESSQSDLS